MVLIVSILAVALVATVSGLLAMPIGIFLGLHPLTVYVTTVVTAIAAMWLLLTGGHRLRVAIADRLAHGEQTGNRARRLVERYGSVGLGLVGPLFPGVVVSSISGVAVGIEARHLGRLAQRRDRSVVRSLHGDLVG